MINGNKEHAYLEDAINAHDKIRFIYYRLIPCMQADCLSHALHSYEKKFASPFKIPILIVSMAADNEESVHYDSSGTVIQKYLTKAVTVEELVSTIKELFK